MESFEKMLSGGHPNSLGRTVEVVDLVLEDTLRLQELFDTYNSNDDVVRLRVSSAFKRITKAKPKLIVKLLPQFIKLSSTLKQASFQWSFAQITFQLDSFLTKKQREEIIAILKNNLTNSDDWIVLNMTMESLTHYALGDEALRAWLVPELKKLKKDKRKSVARRAEKFLTTLQ